MRNRLVISVMDSVPKEDIAERSRKVLETRPASMGATEVRRIPVEGDDADTSETASGTRDRAPADGVIYSNAPTQSLAKKCRVGDLHLALVADKEVVRGHAQ